MKLIKLYVEFYQMKSKPIYLDMNSENNSSKAMCEMGLIYMSEFTCQLSIK